MGKGVEIKDYAVWALEEEKVRKLGRGERESLRKRKEGPMLSGHWEKGKEQREGEKGRKLRKEREGEKKKESKRKGEKGLKEKGRKGLREKPN